MISPLLKLVSPHFAAQLPTVLAAGPPAPLRDAVSASRGRKCERSAWGGRLLHFFIVLFYRPLPDSWRNFKTTTCPPFHTRSLPFAPWAPPLCPPAHPVALLARSKAGQGFNCKFKPVFVSAPWKKQTPPVWRETPTSVWPRADLPPCSSTAPSSILLPLRRPRCHVPAPSLSLLTGNCVCVRPQ